jgi:mRNA interferase RelE/StbE
MGQVTGHSLVYHPDVKDDIRPIPANMRLRIRKAIETRLLKDPAVAGQPLRQSLQGHRKLRVGDYRVIYRVSKLSILILKIGNRKDVYGEVFCRIK